MKKFISLFILICLICFSCSGSSDETEFSFQNNDVESEYKLFDLLDEYPSLKNIFENMDENEFNIKLSFLINPNIENIKEILPLMSELTSNDNKIINDLILNSNSILKRLNIDKNIFNLIDKYRETDNVIYNDLQIVLNKVLNFLDTHYTKEELENNIKDIDIFLTENYGTNVSTVILLFCDSINKLSKQQTINNLNGIEVLFSGVYDLINKDEDIRNTFYGLIREIGIVFNSKINEKEFSIIVKELICNIDKLLLDGGDTYDNNEIYNTVNNEILSDANLNVFINEIFPFVKQLFLRSDRYGSLIDDKFGNKIYPLEVISERLNIIGFDTNNKNNIASKIEESIYEIIRSDISGKDRTNTSSGSFHSSFMESFVNVASTANYVGWDDGGTTGEIYNKFGIMTDANITHGHGNATGYITLNDVFMSIGVKDILNVNILGNNIKLGLYSLAMDKTRTGNNISRSVFPFSVLDKDRYKFAYDQNYKVTSMMSGFQTGDFGIPDGGNQNGFEGEILNSYQAYSIDGYGESSIARWYLEAMERSSFRNESPYFSKEGMTQNGNEFTYYRVDGRKNIIIAKNNINDESTWVYKYPFDGKDDIKDPNNSSLRVNNRYYEVWNSDHYLIHYNNKNYTPGDMSGNATESGALTFKDIIPEKSKYRECSTYEESAYRNFQWMCNDRKYAITVPLYLELKPLLKGAAFLTIECNGFNGLLSARKLKPNKVWARANHNGVSRIPADYRISLDLKSHILGSTLFNSLLKSIVYNQILGTGTCLPAFVCNTGMGATNIAFPFRDYKDEKCHISSSRLTDLSQGDITFEVGDAVWNRRNLMLPLFNHMCGSWFEYAGDINSKNTLSMMIDGLMPMLNRPVYYYQKDEGQFPRNTWKFRNFGGKIKQNDFYGYSSEYEGYFLTRSSDLQNSDADSYWGGRGELEFYQPIKEQGLLSVLIENEKRQCDGLLSLLTGGYDLYKPITETNKPNSRLITKVFRLVYLLGNNELYGDKENFDESDISTYGIRRKIMYGLELITNKIKLDKGDINVVYETSFDKIKHPESIFEKNIDDIDLTKVLDELVGSDTSNKGLAMVVNSRDNWDNFYKLFDIVKELTNNKGKHNIIENIINIIDNTIRKVYIENSEFKSIVKSIDAITLTDDVNNIITKDLPLILNHFEGKYKNLLPLMIDFSGQNNFMDYIHSCNSNYTSSVISDELFMFLDSNIVKNQESDLWDDISEILLDLVDVMGNDEPEWVSNLFQKN